MPYQADTRKPRGDGYPAQSDGPTSAAGPLFNWLDDAAFYRDQSAVGLGVPVIATPSKQG